MIKTEHTEALKPSGVPWIGDIPEAWEVRKLKWLGELSSNGVDKKTKEGEPLFKSVHYMDVYNNSQKKIVNTDGYLVISTDASKSQNCTLRKADVLFTNSSEVPEDMGHSTVIGEDLINTLFGYHLMRFRPSVEMSLEYEKFLFGSFYMRKWFEYRAVGMTRYGLSRKDFTDALIILPPLSEQEAIARYLDDKCSQVDATVEKEKLAIAKLKEYKQAVITEAVTKGLNPHAPLKPSGIPWIGDIPAAWERTKLKRLLEIPITDGPHETPLFIDEGIPFISAEAIKNNTVNFDLKRGYISKEEHLRFSKKCKPKVHDIFMVKSGATTGNIALVETTEEFGIWSPLALMRSNKERLYFKYLFYYLQSHLFKKQVEQFWSYGTQQNIGMEVLGNLFLAYPPSF